MSFDLKKILLLTAAVSVFGASLCGCSSNTPESTIPTIDQTVKSRNGDKVVFFDGEDEEIISPSMDNFNNVWFKIENGDLFVALDEEGVYYRTTITAVDGIFVDERSVDNGIVGDLYVFRGNRILYKISLYSEGYSPFTKADLEKGFGKLTKAK